MIRRSLAPLLAGLAGAAVLALALLTPSAASASPTNPGGFCAGSELGAIRQAGNGNSYTCTKDGTHQRWLPTTLPGVPGTGDDGMCDCYGTPTATPTATATATPTETPVGLPSPSCTDDGYGGCDTPSQTPSQTPSETPSGTVTPTQTPVGGTLPVTSSTNPLPFVGIAVIALALGAGFLRLARRRDIG